MSRFCAFQIPTFSTYKLLFLQLFLLRGYDVILFLPCPISLRRCCLFFLLCPGRATGETCVASLLLPYYSHDTSVHPTSQYRTFSVRSTAWIGSNQVSSLQYLLRVLRADHPHVYRHPAAPQTGHLRSRVLRTRYSQLSPCVQFKNLILPLRLLLSCPSAHPHALRPEERGHGGQFPTSIASSSSLPETRKSSALGSVGRA